MVTKQSLGVVAMAALLVLAGCSSAVPGTSTNGQTDDGTVDGVESAGSEDLTFYISDRPGAIEDFEHLNVTITQVGLHKASGDNTNETEDAEETSTNDTTAPTETTTTADTNETTDTRTLTEETESEAESGGEDGEKGSEWVMKDVDNETVDLTKLKGANATAIGNLSVPAGEYDKVFVYVSEVNATLTNGESVNVKLPSSKLQLNKNFEISANSNPDFVFDINVHKAGNSGKYILRPVVSESGTGDQVEIRKVNKNGKPENPGNSSAKDGNSGADNDNKGGNGNADNGENGRNNYVAPETALTELSLQTQKSLSVVS